MSPLRRRTAGQQKILPQLRQEPARCHPHGPCSAGAGSPGRCATAVQRAAAARGRPVCGARLCAPAAPTPATARICRATGLPDAPVSIGTWIGVLVVLAIPVANLVCAIVWACCARRRSLKNFARAGDPLLADRADPRRADRHRSRPSPASVSTSSHINDWRYPYMAFAGNAAHRSPMTRGSAPHAALSRGPNRRNPLIRRASHIQSRQQVPALSQTRTWRTTGPWPSWPISARSR